MEPDYPDPETRNVLEPDCARCPALVESRERICWGNGDTAADVVVIGEAPGAGAPGAERWKGGNWTGLAYTARHSGRRIRSMFEELGYGPDDLYVTNAVKCFPGNGEGSNREPTPEERANCRAHLRTEIGQVDPAVAVTTGKHATLSVLEAKGRTLPGFLEAVLDPIECPDLGVTVLPVLHPSYQDVWVARLGYEPGEYLDAIGERLDGLVP